MEAEKRAEATEKGKVRLRKGRAGLRQSNGVQGNVRQNLKYGQGI